VTECQKALSAYVPAHASSPVREDFALPLQVYIIETIERDTRRKLLRQLSLVAALVVGMFVGQWPAAFSAANAVPSLPISAQAAGARLSAPVTIERFAFAPNLRPAPGQ
jgi:hypothetical protein